MPVAACVRPLLDLPEAPTAKVVDLVLDEMLRLLFANGWTPVDLVELGQRHIDVAGRSFLLDAVAAVTAGYPDQLVDRRWRAQLEESGARVWWDRRQPHLSQWASRDGHTRDEALGVVIALLGTLDELPRLEQVLPPPGTPARLRASGTSDPTQEKVLVRVRSLLAKAESTDFDDEAEALSAKAQELMSRYALDRALLDHGHGARQQATLSRIWLDNPYVTAKSMLVEAVASANRCRTILVDRWGFTTVVGDEVDLRVVELLATSLLLQGARAMFSTGSQRASNGVSRTRSFRQSFLVAYAGRIGERLREVNDDMTGATAGSSALVPMLSARSRVVDDLISERFPRLVSKAVSVGNATGWSAGRAAADMARLDMHGSCPSSDGLTSPVCDLAVPLS